MKAFLFAAAALGQSVCYLGLLRIGNLRQHIPEALVLFAVAFLLYILTLRILPKKDNADFRSTIIKKRYLLSILALALLFRCILLPSIPSLSDDIYRYVWEGRVVSEGLNPFALAPDSPALAHLRDATIFSLISRTHLTTIYPPLAQYIFAAASFVNYSVYSMKAAFIIFDLATIGLLLLTLNALSLNPLRVALYAINPLVIIEFSGSGHLDSAGICFMMLSLYLCLKRKSLCSAAVLALSFLVKLFPLLLLPAIMRTRKAAVSLIFFCISASAFLPFLNAGQGLFQSLGIYAKNWMFNSALHTLLLQVVQDNQLARRIAAFIFIAIAAGIYYSIFKRQDLEDSISTHHACFLLLGAFLLCTPVVHPWYVCWIVPFLTIAPNRAWLLLSGAVFGSYWILRGFAATGQWLESPVVLCLQYIPFFTLLLYDWLSPIRKRKKPCATA